MSKKMFSYISFFHQIS